jgi:hypothetical protein
MSLTETSAASAAGLTPGTTVSAKPVAKASATALFDILILHNLWVWAA